MHSEKFEKRLFVAVTHAHKVMTETLSRNGPSNATEVLASLPKPTNRRMKILSFGDENTGKSCVIKRYCEERFIPKYITTIGIDYGVKRVVLAPPTPGAVAPEVRVNFWDLAGGAEYLDVRNEFYKDGQGAILVFDVTNAASFSRLEYWKKEAAANGFPSDATVAVVANKVDLPKRAVSEAEGRKWAQSNGYLYFETSANTGHNVTKMFLALFEETFSKHCL